jgi:hypothetical protein
MKYRLITISLLLSVLFFSCDKEEFISFEELPGDARDFINTHFAGEEVAYIEYSKELFDKDYGVYFKSGNKIDFNRKGKWTEINCKPQVPDSVIPSHVLTEVKAKYSDRVIVEIERLIKDKYEVTLDNGLELPPL